MRHRIESFLKTDLFKTSFFNGIAQVIRILTNVVSNKIVAVYLGPAGIALLGQFSNFTSIIMSFASFGINNGVAKYTSEYYDDESKRKSILSTGLFITGIATLITALIVFIFRKYFCERLLHTQEYVSIFTIFSGTLILFSLNAFLGSVLNGYKENKKLITTNIISALVGLVVAIVLVITYGVYGALLGIILSQSLIFFVTIFWVTSSKWFNLQNFTQKFDKKSFIKLIKFSAMTFVSMFFVTFIQLQIRTYIISHISLQDAGCWQGVIKVSDIYLSFITSTLGLYYLPRLSEIKDNHELKKEILKGYKFLLPLTIFSSLLIYLLKDYVIIGLFSKEFQGMSSLFLFQLIGNIFKIGMWLLGFVIIAKAMVKLFIFIEITSGVLYYSLTILFVNKFGVVGATYSYCLNYFLYWVVTAMIFRKVLTADLANGK